MKFILTLVLALVCTVSFAQVGNPWYELSDKHFVVLYNFASDRSLARRILREAEKQYDMIADHIGYTKYQNFWTWDERVQIVLYPDQYSFSYFTGQPQWSRGYAAEHSRLFQSKAIVTYKQENLFLDDILPHEISHLILHDYYGFGTHIPLWFDEGVAQLFQRSRQNEVDEFMRKVVENNSQMPFNKMMTLDIRQVKNEAVVAIFYAQSLSVLKFMIKKYGLAAFQRLCREMKSGRVFEEAMKRSYAGIFSDTLDLEQKWLKHIKH